MVEENLFETVGNQKEKIYERIVNQITDKISRGELKPGDKLPAERDLTKMLNVSRSSLREAMKTLQTIGCVEVKHGHGIFISDKRQENLIELMSPIMFEDIDSVKNLFEIRKTLETQAAAWAALRATEEEINQLEQELSDILKIKVTRQQDIKKHNNRFHARIFKMTHNPVLVKMMSVLNDFINNIYPKTVEIPQRIDRSIGEHQKLLTSIKMRDAEGAKRLMLQHLETVEKEIRSRIKKNN